MRQMEIVEVEAVLEKIWDLHDKLSDAIHSISRTHFLNSVKPMKKSDKKKHYCGGGEDTTAANRNGGFVFYKDFEKESSTIAEAKSLDSIRTALENLEDQLEFFHTVQIQQRSERDAALARLEQSRIILALRLAEHRGKRYKFIEEAMNLVGDVRDTSSYVSPDDVSAGEKCGQGQLQKGMKTNIFLGVLLSGLDSAKKTLKLDGICGILGNAAIFALSMITLVHLQKVPHGDKYILDKQERTVRNIAGVNGSSSLGIPDKLDVMSARG